MNEHSNHINDLMDELLLHIFSFLTPRQLSQCVAPVCTSWHTHARDSLLWRKLSFSDLNKQAAENLFSFAPLSNLRALTVSTTDTTFGNYLVALVAEHCPALQKCYLSADDVDIAALNTLAQNCRNLTNLTLVTYSNYTTFPSFPALQELKLHSLKLCDDGNATMFNGCPHLRQLCVVIRGPGASDQQLYTFLREHQNTLVSFSIVLIHFTISEHTYLCVADCVHLKDMVVQRQTHFTAYVLIRIAASLRELKTLSLVGPVPAVTTAALISAFASPGNLPALDNLHLIFLPAVTDNVLSAITIRLAAQLHRLVLSELVNVTESGVVALVRQCPQLKNLSLIGFSQSITGAVVLALQDCAPKLEDVFILRCIVDQNVIRIFKNRRPTVDITCNNT